MRTTNQSMVVCYYYFKKNQEKPHFLLTSEAISDDFEDAQMYLVKDG